MRLLAQHIFLALVGAYLSGLVLAQDIKCSADEECYNKACCNVPEGQTVGICSYEPDLCNESKGCVSNCDAKAECGQHAADPEQRCPLNACCSKRGFCGTAPDFCNPETGCQSFCFSKDTQPSCGAGSNIFNRRIAYYEAGSATRSCDAWPPEMIPAETLTHVFYSFVIISDDHEVRLPAGEPDGTYDIIERTIGLKLKNPSLQVYIVIGGWAFNDQPTHKHFSNTASTSASRQKFCNSLLEFMRSNAFDGADFDWEYPVADERGGKQEDTDNFVLLVADCRRIFDGSGKHYGLTFTIPSSYWYLKHFDIQGLIDAGANWANLMSYNLHGMWDKEYRWMGNKIGAHTNLTEIKMSLDLLWRNEISPADVVLGFGFYGRSFLIENEDCTKPGCKFLDGAAPGGCSNTSGILTYAEIMSLQDNGIGKVFHVEEDAVNYMVWDSNQWVSYDDARTFKQKVKFAKEKCLGGLMIWAIDQDTYDYRALEGLLGGNIAGGLMDGGELTEDEKEELANDFNRFTGEDCYVSECVTESNGAATCKPGYNVLEFVHHPVGKLSITEKECVEDSWRLICCPSKAMPADCEWKGVQERNGLCSEGTNCDGEHFSLMKDNYNSREGSAPCLPGKRDLCCQAAKSKLPNCRWSECGKSECESDEIKLTESSFSDAGICALEKSSLCCKEEIKNCEWVTTKDFCTITDPACPKGKFMVTEMQNGWDGTKHFTCLNDKLVKYCCDPPYSSSAKWPVDPKLLFENPQREDVSWDYDEHFASNDKDDDHSGAPGNDAFGLVLLDGAEDSFQGEFDNAWVFLETEDESWNLKKRDWADKRTFKLRSLEDTFDNEIEHFRVFCPHGMKSDLCNAIFKGRATDTIIRMPPGIGAGPYSRIVKFDVSGNQTLTRRALRRNRRQTSEEEHQEDTIFDLVVDYNFAAINAEDKGPVQFRVDFSNLVEYWDEITAAPTEELKLRKKWFGKFKQWLSKVTDIEKEDKGSLDLHVYRTWKLFHFEDECRRENSITRVHADLDVTFNVGLNVRYAYYFHGHILPTPKTEDVFGYFSVQPVGSVVLSLSGEGSFQSTSGEKGLLTGLAFPGLSVKGLVRIGPQLDIMGQIDTYLRMSGSAELGVSLMFNPAEIYFPQDADGKAESRKPEALPQQGQQFGIANPQLNIKAQAEGQLSFAITPIASFGIEVLSGKLMRGDISMGLTNNLTLGISADGWTGTSGTGAQLCYWANYNYDLFIRGKIDVLEGTYDWGRDVSLASNDEPIVIKELQCAAFGDADEDPSVLDKVEKRATSGSSIFPASFNCELQDNDSAGNLSLPCWGPAKDTGSDPGSSLKKRAQCKRRPALFYNCFWFSEHTYTVTAKGSQAPENPKFEGICDTIKQGIENGATNSGWSTREWKARLHYKYDAGNSNRNAACGNGKGSKTDECKYLNREYWSNRNANLNELDYSKGEETYSSCDEFPFNASLEGGRGAVVKCVPQYQQDMQGTIMAMLSHFQETITDPATKAESTIKWKDVKGPDYPGYDVYLWYNDGTEKEKVPNTFSDVGYLNSTLIVGGINLWSNGAIKMAKTGNNAVCMDSSTLTQNKKGFGSMRVKGCRIEFAKAVPKHRRSESGSDSADPLDDPNNWGMKIVSMDEQSFAVGHTEDHLAEMEQQMAMVDEEAQYGSMGNI